MSSIYFLSPLDMFKKDIDYAHLISSGREKYGENKYEDSIKEFLSIYKKKDYYDFKVFDFRIKGQLILK